MCCWSVNLATWSTFWMTVFKLSRSDAGSCMVGKYTTIVFSGLTVFAFWLYSVQEGIGLWHDWEMMNATSVACAFRATRHCSGDSVKHSSAITPLKGRSVSPLLWAGIISVIASGMWSVHALEKSIPLRRSLSAGPLCQAATCVARKVPLPSRVYSFIAHGI